MQLLSEDLTIKQKLHSYLNEIDCLVNDGIAKIYALENKVNNIVNVDLVKLVELQNKKRKLDQDNQRLDELINEYFILLKKSEEILATSIFNAQQKLALIDKADNSKHTPEYFVKFAHHISATNSVSAPQNWTSGDQKRPFPQDVEMRQGVLAKLPNPIKTETTSNLLISKLETNKTTAVSNENSNVYLDQGLMNESTPNVNEIKEEQPIVENMYLDFSELTSLPSPQVVPTHGRENLSESSSSSENEAESIFFNFDDN